MDFDLSSTIELGDRRIATIESSELQALIAPNDLENNPINKENSIHSEITLIDKLNAYDAPKIIKEPTRHRHARMLSDVANKKCPLVQAGETHDQRKYIEVEVMISSRFLIENLHHTSDHRFLRLNKEPQTIFIFVFTS